MFGIVGWVVHLQQEYPQTPIQGTWNAEIAVVVVVVVVLEIVADADVVDSEYGDGAYDAVDADVAADGDERKIETGQSGPLESDQASL